MTKKSESKRSGISRREFLGTGAVAGAATMLPGGSSADAQEQAAVAQNKVSPPTPEMMAREVGSAVPPTSVQPAVKRPGSDLMVEVLRDLGIEYVISNPGSPFEGLQESIVNHGNPPNVMPEFITALHEESAVDMAHGYARSEGKPVCTLLSGTIGVQHAAMATYQAFLGRSPVIILVGRDDLAARQQHTADDIAGIVRPYTKWDAQPETLEETLDALQEAYRQAISPPNAPVMVILDAEIQKEEAGDLQVPVYQPPEITGISAADADRIAEGLIAADNPRIKVGRLRTPDGVKQAVTLAELVGASVHTRSTSGPMSFPSSHPLTGPGADTDYDFELGLELPGANASVTGPHLRTLDDRDLTEINFGNIRPPVRKMPDFSGDFDLDADAESSLPLIIESATSKLNASNQKVVEERSAKHEKANHQARIEVVENAVEDARLGWNDSPVSVARVYAELWPLIKDLDWCLASPTVFTGGHHVGLWTHDKPYSYLGVHPAAALGYCLGASAGAALAARNRNRIVINFQGDGDFNYTPGAMWTAAHHKLPMLTIIHNNGGYHMELMYLQYMAGVRGRGTDRMHIGSTFRNPEIDFASIAKGYGVKSEGPIDNPGELRAALVRGVEAVTSGEPYLIDVISQPR